MFGNPEQWVWVFWSLANIHVQLRHISVRSTLATCVWLCQNFSSRVSMHTFVCVSVSVSLCLGCRCFVSLMRGVRGPPRRPVQDNLLLFCYESSSERNRRNSLKWRRARLNNSAITINFGPRLISTPSRTTGSAGSSWECWQFPVQCILWTPWQPEKLREHGYLCEFAS